MSLIVYSNIYKQKIKSNIDYIFKNSILIDSLWEHNICEKICSYIKDGTDFIDVGANIGLITLGVKLYFKYNNLNKSIQKFHCFECDNENFSSLIFNTSNYTDINLYNFALGDNNQLCQMSVSEYNNGLNTINTTYTKETTNTYNYTHINDEFKKNQHIFISVMSLDSILHIFKNNVSVIKIDVEGFELLVLEGSKQFLEKHKPVIIIEIFDEQYTQILELLNKLNYVLIENLGNLNYVFIHT